MTDVYTIEMVDICGPQRRRFAVGFCAALVVVHELVTDHPKLRLRISLQGMDPNDGSGGLSLADQESVRATAIEARQLVYRRDAARWLRDARAALREGMLDDPRSCLRWVDRLTPFLSPADQQRVERIVEVLKRRMWKVITQRAYAAAQTSAEGRV